MAAFYVQDAGIAAVKELTERKYIIVFLSYPKLSILAQKSARNESFGRTAIFTD